MRRKRQKKVPQVPAITAKEEEEARLLTIVVIDEFGKQFEELLRTGVCPGCEEISTMEEVDKHPEHEEHEAMMGREADGYLQWTSKHTKDCSFMDLYQEVPNWASHFHIVIGRKRVVVPYGDKAWVDWAPVRIPALGDPPVPD
jgi:hypothetical protein